MAKWIKANGETKEVEPKNKKDFQLKELQEFVGGYIELVHLEGNKEMVVNEEGLIYELPANEEASLLAGTLIVGDVLVCDRKEIR